VPANLTQQYYAAEEAYKKASTYEEKLAALEEMLATVPKHKGTEKIQAEIKKRLSRMRKEDGQTQGGGSRQEDPFLIDAQGAGQVLLLGHPNSGKSALVQTLTNAKTQVAEYPFATVLPIPGMMKHEDVSIQLVDTPPFVLDGIPGNFSSAIRNSHMLGLVLDLTDPDCIDHLTTMLEYLREKRILREEVPEGVRALTLDKVLILGNKADLTDWDEIVEMIEELVPDCPTIVPVSAVTGFNLDQFRALVFERLQVIRVYTKRPGKKPDLERPFVLPVNSTVSDLAHSIHKDIADNLRTAKVWGSAKFDGQAVNHDYVLADRDIVELND
jgi:hypothetical protein